MSDQLPITVPCSDEIERRIADCRAELKALERLRRISVAAERAAQSRDSRPPLNQTESKSVDDLAALIRVRVAEDNPPAPVTLPIDGGKVVAP